MSEGGSDQCPVCGSGLVDYTADLGIQWCDECEMGYWQYGGNWFVLGDGDGIARYVEPDTDRENGGSR